MTRERQTYHLPIDVIIETMRGLHEPMYLCAEVPASPDFFNQKALAQIMVDKNSLQCCVIAEKSGKTLFSQGEAFRLLQQYGTLDWTLQSRISEPVSLPAQPSPAQIPINPQQGEPIPYRLVQLAPGQLQALSPAQKKVFALVNGRYTVAHIAHLLTKTPQEVYHVLLELKQLSLIDLSLFFE
ncbi:MAG TPA: hypothetical protein VFV38_16145 [Ktedonobacteraceae bacterium]|nr:hypothetical protein [Ktedonobacteraceae bacterium]